jgi:hypothetical protein
MQLKHFFGLAVFASSVVSAAIEKRDAKPITDALKQISTSVQAMTSAVNVFDGDAVKGAAILVQAESLLDIISKSQKTISPIDPLVLADAVQVLAPGNALITDIEKVIDALISKKAAFDKSNLSSVVTSTLQKFRSGAEALLKVITAKLPANVSSVGDSIGKKIYENLDKGIAAFPK